MLTKQFRCKGCNMDETHEHSLDPKKELCNRCFIKKDEFTDKKLVFELQFDADLNEITADELYNYVESFVACTKGIAFYNLEIKKHD